MCISDSLILFPKDQIISFIQLHYKASQLATLPGILWALLVSWHSSSLIHLFTCLSLTHWLNDRNPMCSLSKLVLQQLISILAPALSDLPGNESSHIANILVRWPRIQYLQEEWTSLDRPIIQNTLASLEQQSWSTTIGLRYRDNTNWWLKIRAKTSLVWARQQSLSEV